MQDGQLIRTDSPEAVRFHQISVFTICEDIHNVISLLQTYYFYGVVNVRLLTFLNKHGRPGIHPYGNKTPQQWGAFPLCHNALKRLLRSITSCLQKLNRTEPGGGSVGCAGPSKDLVRHGSKHQRKIRQQQHKNSTLGLYLT